MLAAAYDCGILWTFHLTFYSLTRCPSICRHANVLLLQLLLLLLFYSITTPILHDSFSPKLSLNI